MGGGRGILLMVRGRKVTSKSYTSLQPDRLVILLSSVCIVGYTMILANVEIPFTIILFIFWTTVWYNRESTDFKCYPSVWCDAIYPNLIRKQESMHKYLNFCSLYTLLDSNSISIANCCLSTHSCKTIETEILLHKDIN